MSARTRILPSSSFSMIDQTGRAAERACIILGAPTFVELEEYLSKTTLVTDTDRHAHPSSWPSRGSNPASRTSRLPATTSPFPGSRAQTYEVCADMQSHSYNRYLAVASRVVRRSLKEEKRLAAERRGESDLRFAKWEVSSTITSSITFEAQRSLILEP